MTEPDERLPWTTVSKADELASQANPSNRVMCRGVTGQA
jgi:hypothetical protein